MNDIEMVRALRIDYRYSDIQRHAARTALLTAAGGGTVAPARSPSRAGRRKRVAWLAGLGGALAAGVGAAIVASYAGSGTVGPRVVARGGQTAGQVLELAARTARDAVTGVPATARWQVLEYRYTSTAAPAPQCLEVAVLPAHSSTPTRALRGFTTCAAKAPASIPQLATAKPAPIPDLAGGPKFSRLPGQPGPLLAALYRLGRAGQDALPGHAPPPATAAELHEYAFDELGAMLNDGVTSPSRSAQLAAMARIPGIEIVHGAKDALGRPGISITLAHGVLGRSTVIFDARTYAFIGRTWVDRVAGSAANTHVSTLAWQAYYDSHGNKL